MTYINWFETKKEKSDHGSNMDISIFSSSLLFFQ